MSTLDPTLEPKSTTVRRLEMITGVGGRRRWSEDDKNLILEETLAPGAVVSDVARRHGLRPQQLFTWRREARHRLGSSSGRVAPLFVPAVVAKSAVASTDEAQPRSSSPDRRCVGRSASPGATATIELEIGGVTVRVGRDAEAATIAAVIRALKAGA